MVPAENNQTASLKDYTLLTVTIASFLTSFMGSAVNLAVPAIGERFNSNTFMLSWVVTAYLLSSAAFLVPFGRLADITDRRKIFTVGVAVFAFSSFLCGMAWRVEALIAFRVLQGMGGAMIFGTAMAMLASVFPPQERGKAIGINVAGVYTGLSLGPVLGGIITYRFGWEFVFYLGTLFGILPVLLSGMKLKGKWAGIRGEKFDLTGAVLYAIGLVSVMYGLSSIAEVKGAKYILALGAMVMLAFARHEMKTEYPVFNLRLFRNVPFAFSNLAALINYSATFAIGFVLSLFLQVVRGFDPQTAGLILLFQPVIMAFLSPFAGMLSDRIEPRVLSSIGMGVTAIGLFLFFFIGIKTPVTVIMANLVLIGAGFALFSSPNSNAVMASVEKRFYGLASSTLSSMRLIGQAISMAIVTLIIALYVEGSNLNPAHAGQLVKAARISFIVFAFICFGGVFASLARGKVIGTESKQ